MARQNIGDRGGEGYVARVGDIDSIGQLCPGRHRVWVSLLGHTQCGRKLVGADVVTRAHRSCFTVNVCRDAGGHTCVHCRRSRSDVIVPLVGIYKDRVIPEVDRASDDTTRAAPVGSVALPQRGLQCSCAAGGDGDAHRMTDQDGVGQGNSAILPPLAPDINPTAVAATVAGNGTVQQTRGRRHDTQPAAGGVGLIIGDDIIDQCGVAAVQVQSAACIGGVAEYLATADSGRGSDNVHPAAEIE